MTFESSFDPDEAPQNVEPNLISKQFNTHIIISDIFYGKRFSFAIFERQKIEIIYSACEE